MKKIIIGVLILSMILLVGCNMKDFKESIVLNQDICTGNYSFPDVETFCLENGMEFYKGTVWNGGCIDDYGEIHQYKVDFDYNTTEWIIGNKRYKAKYSCDDELKPDEKDLRICIDEECSNLVAGNFVSNPMTFTIFADELIISDGKINMTFNESNLLDGWEMLVFNFGNKTVEFKKMNEDESQGIIEIENLNITYGEVK